MQEVEVCYVRGACIVTEMDVENSEDVYERFGMCVKEETINCGVVN